MRPLTGRITAAVVLMLVLGCQPRENQAPAPASDQPQRREPRPVRILGQIQLRGENDASGIQIYIPGTSLIAITGRDGRFALTGAGPGRQEVWARAEGYQPVALGEIKVSPSDDREAYSLSPVTLDFQPQSESADAGRKARSGEQGALGSIRGRLRSTDTELAPEDWSGATVVLEKTPYRTTAAADGSFLLWNLPADRYLLTVRMEGFQTTTTAVRVLPGDEATTTVLALVPEEGASDGGTYIALRTYPVETAGPAGRVPTANAAAATTATTASAGRIRGVAHFNREGVEDHSGIAISLTGSSLTAITAEDGAYVLENVKPGRYQLLAQAEGYKPARLQADVAAGADLEAPEILLEPDLVYPMVIQAIPPPGTRNVTVQREIPLMLRFNKKMNPEALRRAVRLEPEAAYQVFTGREAPDTDFDLLKIVIYGARQPLVRFDTPYRLIIDQSATDFEGLAMEEPFLLNFRTGRAEIYRTEPANGASAIGMSPLTPVVVSFNAPLDAQTVNASQISISPRLDTTPVVGLREDPTTGWSSLIINGMWRPDTTYRITIQRGVRTIGNTPIANAPYHFRFRTARLTLPRVPKAPKAVR